MTNPNAEPPIRDEAYAGTGFEGAAAAFAEEFSPWGLQLPPSALAERVPGSVRNSRGWHMRFNFGEEGGREYLNIFASHRMTNDRLYRLYADGELSLLDASWDIMASQAGGKEHEENFYRMVQDLGLMNRSD